MGITRTGAVVPTQVGVSPAAPVTVTTSATQHAAGAWAEVHSAAAVVAGGTHLLILAQGPTQNENFTVEIGFGTTVQFHVPLRTNTSNSVNTNLVVPWRTPAGTQIQARGYNHSTASARAITVRCVVIG